MNRKEALDYIKKLKSESQKKKFVQSVDVIINLQDLDLKKVEQQVDFFLTLNNSLGRKMKVCALIGPELADEAKICDLVIPQMEFDAYAANKKKIKKLAKNYDFFIAQANMMNKIASIFGRVLGPKGKMPNPKAGCVVPPKTSLKPIYERLQKTIRISAKKDPIIYLMLGKEDMKDEELADNLFTVYEQLILHLPSEKHNIKNVYLKTTMGKPIKI